MRGSFPGGIRPRTYKDLTAGKATRTLPPPREVVIPLSQHAGAPARACVERDDDVRIGQVVGEADGLVSVPVHSSVSGRVKAVEERPHPAGRDMMAVVVESDAEDRWIDLEPLDGDVLDAPGDLVRRRVLQAGIVGMGGAAFPSHVKLSPPTGGTIDTVILNGCECEPFLTADHRLMVEQPGLVATGLGLVVRAAGARRGLVAVEADKPDAADALGPEVERVSRRIGVPLKVRVVPVVYPHGAEKQLVFTLTRRRVPGGALPVDVGALVHNVQTAAAMVQAVSLGRPLVTRIVTVSGDAVREPGNFLVRIGTPVAALLEAAGGCTGQGPITLVVGGPMTGAAQCTDEAPVLKATSGVLALSGKLAPRLEPGPCVRCGECVRHCPMRLDPTGIAIRSEHDMLDEAAGLGALECIECGCCSWGCPACIPIVQLVRRAKVGIMARRAREGAS